MWRLVILKLPFKFPPPSDQVKNIGELTSVRQERGRPMGEGKPVREIAPQPRCRGRARCC